MKKHLLLCMVILFMASSWISAQKITKEKSTRTATVTAEELEKLPFTKRTWEFTITKPNLAYSHQQVKVNGIDQGSRSNFLLDVGTQYYVADHFGVGIEVLLNSSTSKNNGYKQELNSWMSYGDLTYGFNINSTINIYTRAGVGVGGVVNKTTSSFGPATKSKSDLFGYKFNIGAPIRLEQNGNTYLTPEIGYWYNREKFDDGTETDNRFGFGLKLETFLACGKAYCKTLCNYRSQYHVYGPGSNFLGVSTSGGVYFGNTKSSYNNNNFPGRKQQYSLTDLSVNYNYYFIKNLSVGLNVDFGNSEYKNNDNNYRQSNTNFTITPMLELNMPVSNPGLNDLFIRGGYSFGTQKFEYRTGSISNTTKYSVGNFCAGIGYNFFFRKGLSLTPIFEYDWTTNKDKDNDQKEKLTGPDFSIGVRKFFR